MSKLFWFLAFGLLGLVFGSPVVEDKGSRILGGSPAMPVQFPFQASIRNLANLHLCGGTIIHYRTILTSYFCISNRELDTIKVVVGADQLDSTSGRGFIISEVIFHPENEIALLILTRDMGATQLHNPAILVYDPVAPGTTVQMAGWGHTAIPIERPNDLQFLTTTILPSGTCFNHDSNIPLTPGQICTRTDSGFGACWGDEGGPVVLENSRQLVGVITRPGCFDNTEDISARISYYAEWIDANKR